MPGIGGLELLRRLKAAGSDLPTIVVTSATDAWSRARATEEGAAAYLNKPVSDEVLIRHLATALGPDRMPRQTEDR